MSWVPTLLNWPAALIAAGVAVPSLLLLYFLKLRRQERRVSSTILWKKAVQDLQVNSPFQKLRRNLLLLLQMLILAAILFALANPITFYRPGAAMNTVILIDRSASMNATDGDAKGGTRLADAKRRAIDLVDSLPRGGRAMIIAFDDVAETAQPYTTDVPALKTAINAITPTDRPSKLQLAYQLADAQQAAEGERASTQRVFLFSDGRVTDAADVTLKGELRYERVGDDKSKNIAIVSLSAKRNYDKPTEVQVFARLANFGPEVVKTDVQLSVATLENPKDKDKFEIRQVKSDLQLLPARWTDAQRAEAEKQNITGSDGVEFTLDLSDAAVIRLEQTNKDGDVLPVDDVANVVVPPPKPLSVALVTDGNYFLERFFEKAAVNMGLKNTKTFSGGDWEVQKSAADFDVIVFDRYVPKSLPAAGNFIWFDALPDGLPLKVQKDDKGVAQTAADQTVLDWKRDHPMLREVPLRKLYAARALKLTVPLADEVLIDGTDTPLVVLAHAGRSTHLVIAFDAMESNWPLQLGYPLFLKQSLEYLAAGSNLGVRESFQPGSSPRLPRANLERAGTDLKRITLAGPQGARTVDVPPTGDFALPAINYVGVYATDPPVPQYERLAVNLLDATESNTLPTDTAPGDSGPAAATDPGRTPLQWWWWLILAAVLPILLIEWWVYAKRVHA